MRRLIDVRKDIVHTIRQAVDIVSKYAGGALPEPARTRVRGFILTLPQRWASKASAAGGGAAGTAGGSERDSTVTAAASGSGATRRPGGQRRAAHRERGADLRSGASSRAPSPTPSSRVSRRRNGDVGEGGEGSRVSAGTALVTARRILALATESLDMMRNVTGVMKDSLDRAEAYVVVVVFDLLLILLPDGSVVYEQLVFNVTHKNKTPIPLLNLNFLNVVYNIIIAVMTLIRIYLVHLFSQRLLRFGDLVYLLLLQGTLLRLLMLLLLLPVVVVVVVVVERLVLILA